MNIGLAGPVSVELLKDNTLRHLAARDIYRFPLLSLLANAYITMGHQVTIFSCEFGLPKPEMIQGEAMRLALAGMRRRARDRALDAFAQERHHLAHLMSSSGCDIIHAHWTYEFALAALSTTIPTVVTCHDQPLRVLALHRDPYRAVRTAMAVRVAHRAPMMTAVSPDVAAHLRRWFRHRKPIAVVPNGVPAWLFDLPRHRRSTGPVQFATVLQGWSRLKNAPTAIEAFSRVRQEIPDARLAMFGDDYAPGGAASQWACSAGLDPGVSFEGMLPHEALLRELSDRVDVLVHPSLQESLPMTVIEAMALGVPVIGGARSGGVPQVLPSDAGSLVDVSKVVTLAAGMKDLALDPAGRQDKARRARDHARTYYTIEGAARDYLNVYERALAP